MEHKTGPDFLQVVSIEGVPEGGLLEGRVGEEKVVLARRGNEFFAVGAECTHYHGPLAKGLIVGDELHCPWHHACFSLRTGEVLRTPAFDPIPCWRVERVGNDVFVREKLPAATRRSTSPQSQHMPKSVVIVGGGAAGFAAADTLRREGYDGAITMISADEFAPYDRPNLSKDYLAGSAPDEWMPLRSPDYYADQRIELLLKTRVTSIDTRQKHVAVENGRTYEFDRLLLATGADPVKLPIPGASESQLHYLRTY